MTQDAQARLAGVAQHARFIARRRALPGAGPIGAFSRPRRTCHPMKASAARR